jgi:dTDP-4-amino-4,6-dideoxygalactose transaminase
MEVYWIFFDGAAWSLQGKKILSAGEGGLFSTPHEEFYQRAVLLGHFNKRAKIEVSISHFLPYTTTGLGMNLRMHPLGAAVAYAQLERLEQQLTERRETAAILAAAIAEIDGLILPFVPDGADHRGMPFRCFLICKVSWNDEAAFCRRPSGGRCGGSGYSIVHMPAEQSCAIYAA